MLDEDDHASPHVYAAAFAGGATGQLDAWLDSLRRERVTKVDTLGGSIVCSGVRLETYECMPVAIDRVRGVPWRRAADRLVTDPGGNVLSVIEV